METLFRCPSGKSRQIVRHVRRDPQFAPQLYFVTTEKCGPRLLVSFEQAIWDTASNQITSRIFFQFPHVADESQNTLQFAIDEKGKCVYVVYDIAQELVTGRLDLKYEKPDKLGYRNVSVSAYGIKKSFILQCGDTSFAVTAINVCPSTAQLIFHFKLLTRNRSPLRMGLMPQRCDITDPHFKLYDGEVETLNPLQSIEMEARSHVFSRSEDLLTLISYHDRNLPFDALDDEARNQARMISPDGFMILYSHDAQMKPINTLRIDPVQIVQNFLPKTVYDGLSTAVPYLMPNFMFFGSHLQLLGHVHKYVLFFFHHHYVLAAKWPKNWYKLQQVPVVQLKRAICVDKQKQHGEILDVWLVSTDLYFKVDQSGAEAIRRMSLGHKFKDHRTCAFCGIEEKRKKKNSAGKRMSSFNVCRLCKELNLHKCCTDARNGCHYCSLECMKKHWKEHKQIHSGKGK